MNNDILTQQQIEQAAEDRANKLNGIKDLISKKFLYALEDKLAAEKKSLQQILDWQEGRNTELSKYTHVLDPHYFEQEFLN